MRPLSRSGLASVFLFLVPALSLLWWLRLGHPESPSGPTDAPSARPVSDRVVAYTPFPDVTAHELAEAFTARTGIQVEQVLEGTTRVFARLRAEKNHPRADVWYGGGGMIPFMTAARDDLLEPYRPRGHEQMPVRQGNLIQRDEAWRWVGLSMISLGLAYNPQKLAPADLPQSWADLAAPRWKGQIEIWDPAESGTAMLFLESALLRAINAGHGEQAGWDYLVAFFGNLKRYSREGPPAFAVARGQTLLGIHVENQYLEFLEAQAGGGPVAEVQKNLRWYLPPDSPVIVEGIALIKGGPNPQAGRRFIDFCLSSEGQRIVNRYFFTLDPTLPPPAHMGGVTRDELLGKAMRLEPEWMAENYDRVRRIWQNQVEATAEE